MANTKRLDRASDTLGDSGCAVGATIVEHNSEFLSTIARDDACLSHRLKNTQGDRFQAFVARLMSIPVVLAFEVVDIGQKKRNSVRIPSARFPANACSELRIEVPSIE